MEKPIRENYENDELFFDAVAEYLKKSERKKLTYICIGLEPKDAETFKAECKTAGLNMSEKVRELIKDYIYPMMKNF